MSIKGLNNGKHRVLVLGSEKKFLTVQFSNGSITSFPTKFDFTALNEYLEGAVIDIKISKEGKRRAISLADDSISNIITDNNLLSCVRIVEKCREETEKLNTFSNFAFNEICNLAEERIEEKVKETVSSFENQKIVDEMKLVDLTCSFFNEILDKDITLNDAKSVSHEVVTDVLLLSIGGMPVVIDDAAKLAATLKSMAFQELCAKKETIGQLLYRVDKFILPYKNALQIDAMKQIKRRIAHLSYVQESVKNVCGSVCLVTETPILAKLENGEYVEIDTKRMTPKAYWCLLVNKSYGDKCFFLHYADNNKVVPHTILEKTSIPEEALEDMKLITEFQLQLANVYSDKQVKQQKYDALQEKTLELIFADRTVKEDKEYCELQKKKDRLNDEISDLIKEADDLEMTIADLKINWIKKFA